LVEAEHGAMEHKKRQSYVCEVPEGERKVPKQTEEWGRVGAYRDHR
jgi:hypothetical protein